MNGWRNEDGNPVAMKIGILALQGAFGKHQHVLSTLGVQHQLVKHADDLDVNALIIPGGESTTMTRVLQSEGWLSDVREYAKRYPVFGTCAGAILLSNRVDSAKVIPWEIVNMSVHRNAYGRQVESFEEEVSWGDNGEIKQIPAVFIRAPRIVEVGPGVEILGRLNDEPVVVREGHAMASTFHPELTGSLRIHRYFIDEVCKHAKAA